MDANLMHVSYEGGILEDPWTEPAKEMFLTTKDPAEAPDAPEIVEVHVQLATAYNRLKRTEDAEREKAIVDRLNAEAAAKQKGKGGDSDNSRLHNSQLPMNSQRGGVNCG